MALSAEDQQRIVQQESAWLDDAFGQVDLSSFPALAPPTPETSRDDARFARDWRDTALSASATALRRFVEDPDVSALERIAEETGNPDYLREVGDRRGETVAIAFKRKCPNYLPTDPNFRLIVSTLQFNGLRADQQDLDTDEAVHALVQSRLWTVPNLEAAYRALDREGLLQVPAGTARNLSDQEKLRVMRLASSGFTEQAIEEFLHCALPDEELSIDVINDPAYRSVCDQAVLYIWEISTTDYSPSAERRSFLLRFAAGRVLTLNLLNQAWQNLKQREADYTRSEVLDQFQRPQETPPPTAKEIDAMDDASVDRLYHDSLRAYAQSIRGAGILA